MFQSERHQKILALLAEENSSRVADLSESLNVSEATIRRDLDRLEEEGLIQRTHGGALLVESRSSTNVEILRVVENQEAKVRIGQAAAALIQDGDAVFIGSGTTTLEVARNLCGRRNLTVITNALNVINLLAREEGISLVSTGGMLRSSELSFLGHITEQVMREVRPQKVFMGLRAFSLEGGLTSDYLPEVSTDRAILESGLEIIIVADHTKIGKVAAGFVAPITVVDKLITDDQADPEDIRLLQEKGIEVIVC
jgi:DeoR/GlpR family transcriptional regulator of sugar metabolism